jgi:hypothetical protein
MQSRTHLHIGEFKMQFVITLIVMALCAMLDADSNLSTADAWVVPNASARYDVTLNVAHEGYDGTIIIESVCMDILEDGSTDMWVGTDNLCSDSERVSDALFYALQCEEDDSRDNGHICKLDYDPDDVHTVHLPFMSR